MVSCQAQKLFIMIWILFEFTLNLCPNKNLQFVAYKPKIKIWSNNGKMEFIEDVEEGFQEIFLNHSEGLMM